VVAAKDPVAGELTAQPVLDVIVGFGDKHLIGVTTSRAPPAGEGSSRRVTTPGSPPRTTPSGSKARIGPMQTNSRSATSPSVSTASDVPSRASSTTAG
jgi:hypothetical protein